MSKTAGLHWLAAVAFLVAIALVLPLIPSSAQERTELEFGSWQWLEPGGGDVWRKLAAGFTAENPGITIKEVAIPFPRYEETMLVRMTGGQAPDLLLANTFMFFNFQGRDMLQPLDPLAQLAKYRADFHPGSQVAQIRGQSYGLMVQWNPYALLYNRKLFQAAGVSVPTTPTEFLAAALKLTKPPVAYGYGTRHSLAEEAGWWFEFSYWIYAFGGRWVVDGRPAAESPKVLDGVRFFKRLYDAYVFPRGVDAATYRRMFAEEKVAMITDVPSLWLATKTQNQAVDLAVAKNPFGPNPPVTLGANVLLTIPKGARNAKQAAIFVDWLYRHLADLGEGYGTITGSRQANELVFKKQPFLKTFAEMPVVEGGGLVPPGFEAAFGEFRHIVLERVSEVLLGSQSVEQAMGGAQKSLEDLARRQRR